MPEEEKKAVEGTETTEEKKDGAVLETKEKASDGAKSGGASTSEDAVAMLKAALPKELPLGTVLKMNYFKYFPNKPDTPPEYGQAYIIGLPDGNVGTYTPAGAGSSEYAEVEVASYDAFIETTATLGADESLESVCCGCSMPSKDSTMFVANYTVVNENSK